MDATIQEAKIALRRLVGERMGRMPGEVRDKASAQARALLAAQPLWQRARSVLFYAPLPGELDVWPLLSVALRASKKVALPRFDQQTKAYAACQVQNPETDLQAGRFGIREPGEQCPRMAPGVLDLILIPGVAFDAQGGRLGRGKGYYDQLLEVTQGRRCGVAFDEQTVEKIPCEAHDARMDCLLTPTRWIELPA